MSISREASKFIARTDLRDIPEPAYEVAKKAFIDTMGVALAGSRTRAAQIAADLVSKSDQATIIGTEMRTTPGEAALCNGVMAHVLDLDDHCYSWVGHPSVAMIPALLALGEERHLSGKQLLLSYIVGFEVGAKIGVGVLRRLREVDWHPTAVLGSVAAAASSARLLGLDDHRTLMALGISASLAGGLRRSFGTMTKSLHAGVAARNGLMAAQLAEKGFTGAEDILEAPQGFLKAFFDSGYEAGLIFKDLGKQFEIITSGISIKAYPSCAASHRCVNAMLDIVQGHAIAPEEVAEIECKTSNSLRVSLIHSRPRTGLEAKFSLAYCVSVALIDGKVGLDQFSDERVTDSRVQGLIPRVKWVNPEAMDTLEGRFGLPEEVTVKLADGRRYSAKVIRAKGDFENPLSMAELADKYRGCASSVLSSSQTEHSLRLLMDIESCQDINEITRHLAVTRPR